MKDEKRIVRIGLLGLGTVGAELANSISRNASRVKEEHGIELTIAKVFVRNVLKKRNILGKMPVLTTNPYDVLADPDINIICECMGGNGFKQTKEYLLEAAKNKKHLILSSKKTLALYAPEILDACINNKVQIRFDATVGGGIPITKVFNGSFRGDTIIGITGILNATSNYIYSKMSSEHIGFSEALKQAQQKGYAENDPSDDVDGYDALYKLCILTMLGMRQLALPESLQIKPYRNIDLCDMQYAEELGYSIKPLALVNRVNGHFEYHVGPTLVNNYHILANTSENYNSIMVRGRDCGELGFYGQGAGDKPTAFAMYDDLLNLIVNNQQKNSMDQDLSKIKQLCLHEQNSKKYWRLNLKNKPGMLSKLTTVFANFNINIEKILQKNETHDCMELVLITGYSSISCPIESELSGLIEVQIKTILNVA